jgi:DNA-directed RNA polymerase beta' subunit
MRVKLIRLDEGFSPTQVVTNPIPVIDKTGTFSEDGVFSERIFGRMPSSGREYTCDCGCLDGRFYEGTTCPTCGSEVSQRDTVFAKRGWIDLEVYRIVSPLFYAYFSHVCGATTLAKILHQRRILTVDGRPRQTGHGLNFENLGMLAFAERWEEVLEHFEGKKRSDPRVADYTKLIRENSDLIMVGRIPVFSHILRPALIVNRKLVFDEINNVFNLAIANARALAEYSGPERNEATVNSALWRIQERANELFEHVLRSLSRKQGYIRNSLLGVRINFSARCVITPLPPGHDKDEIVIPYLTFLELYRFQLTNLIVRLRNVSLREATEVWSRAQTVFDRTVYAAMRELIRRAGGGLPALLNRNPTIAFGSILRVRITGVKRDPNDLTAGINNGVLRLLGADFDGDVCNIIVLPDEDFEQAYEVFDPRLMMVSRDGPGLNREMRHDKDHALGLSVLTEDPFTERDCVSNNH